MTQYEYVYKYQPYSRQSFQTLKLEITQARVTNAAAEWKRQGSKSVTPVCILRFLMLMQAAEWKRQGSKSVTPVCILRFLGTSPDSSSIIPLLHSLCEQICINYEAERADIPGELSPLVLHFKKLLMLATHDKPLIIFLDSLDQLSGANGE